MELKFFDSHCHLQFPQYKDDLPEVLSRMQEHKVGGVVIGTDFKTSRAGLELAKQYDFLWASVGLHPNDDEDFDISKYEELVKDPKVVAVGECGLDYFRSSGEGQREKFEAQIMLAQKFDKALVIHCRNAHDDVLKILDEHKPTVPVVIHFFTGTAELAQKYLALGCYLSFPGPITYTDMYDESVRVALLDKILAETDAPFAAPVPHRGTRNEPSYVEEVVKKIATLKGISLEDMGRQTVDNALRAFGLQ